jgi:glycosyltransferase involved in cell wall biosynthesis
MTVSAALIVKNEEKTLGRCLASIDGAVDELVVVDTGSDDATKAVAASHGARVFDFTWQDDFAAARQYAFEQTTGDWVFWLDADDVVVGADRIRHVTANAAPDVTGFYWRYILGRDGRGQPTFTCWRERCVRNDGSSRWTGRVHEVLVARRPNAIVRTDEVIVEHHPEPSRGERSHRNLRILEDECARGVAEPRMLFYLGREYADHGDLPRAIHTLQRYAAVSLWDDERYLAQVQIADLLRAQREYGEALDAYWVAMKTHPSWPDAFFGLAATYYFLAEWQKVAEWTDIARLRPRPNTLLFLNVRNYDFNWIIYYTNALFHLGRFEEALAWTRTALTMVPDDPWHVHNHGFFSSAVSTKASRAPDVRVVDEASPGDSHSC